MENDKLVQFFMSTKNFYDLKVFMSFLEAVSCSRMWKIKAENDNFVEFCEQKG